MLGKKKIKKKKKEKGGEKFAGLEVLTIQRIREEEVLLVLKKGGDVSAFEKALSQAVGKWPKSRFSSQRGL